MPTTAQQADGDAGSCPGFGAHCGVGHGRGGRTRPGRPVYSAREAAPSRNAHGGFAARQLEGDHRASTALLTLRQRMTGVNAKAGIVHANLSPVTVQRLGDGFGIFAMIKYADAVPACADHAKVSGSCRTGLPVKPSASPTKGQLLMLAAATVAPPSSIAAPLIISGGVQDFRSAPRLIGAAERRQKGAVDQRGARAGAASITKRRSVTRWRIAGRSIQTRRGLECQCFGELARTGQVHHAQFEVSLFGECAGTVANCHSAIMRHHQRVSRLQQVQYCAIAAMPLVRSPPHPRRLPVRPVRWRVDREWDCHARSRIGASARSPQS